jgi:hypothetical protein
MWCRKCYTSSVDVTFPTKKKALDEYEELEDPSEREKLQGAWGKMHEPDDEFYLARNGEHCMVPFECDLCVFRKLKRRSPDLTNPGDDLLIACIRQRNLDAFWSRSKYTVRGNHKKRNLPGTIKIRWVGGTLHRGWAPP